MVKKIGYGRVSTGGQDYEQQEKELLAAGVLPENIYCEKFTGTKMERPKFQYVLSILEKGDTLVVSKMDRFARSTVDAIQTIRTLFDRGVTVHILNMGVIEDSSFGRLAFNIMSAFAEFERDLIIERTQAGKALARTNKGANYSEGRPTVHKRAKIEHALALLQNHTYSEVSEKLGISESTLHRARRKRLTAELTVTPNTTTT